MFRVLIPVILSVTMIAFPARSELALVSAEAGVFRQTDEVHEEGVFRIATREAQIEDTRRVVASIGTQFGIRYSVSGKKPTGNQVTLLYLTPGIVSPDGIRHDKYTEIKDLRASARSHTMAFKIAEPYELVPGTWQMMVFEEDRLLVSETFEVIIKGTETLSEFK